LNCDEYHARVTINTPHMPEQSEVINKLILSAIIKPGLNTDESPPNAKPSPASPRPKSNRLPPFAMGVVLRNTCPEIGLGVGRFPLTHGTETLHWSGRSYNKVAIRLPHHISEALVRRSPKFFGLPTTPTPDASPAKTKGNCRRRQSPAMMR